MKLEELQQEAENLKSIDANNLTPEQMIKLVEKLSSLMDASESALLGVKTELDQVKTEIEIDEANNS
jgi:hypothetical protein